MIGYSDGVYDGIKRVIDRIDFKLHAYNEFNPQDLKVIYAFNELRRELVFFLIDNYNYDESEE